MARLLCRGDNGLDVPAARGGHGRGDRALDKRCIRKLDRRGQVAGLAEQRPDGEDGTAQVGQDHDASLGQFEPDVWIPSSHPAARRGVIGLDELTGLDVIHGPRRASPAIYEHWLKVLRTVDPRFEFTDPPLRHSLALALTFAATASRPAAVLTGPAVIAGPPPGVIRLPRPVGTGDMTRVGVAGHPLTATAALVWNGDLPRPLQQILFDTADGVTPPPASSPPAAVRPQHHYEAGLTSGGAPALAGSWN
jgi:hypothetical protein